MKKNLLFIASLLIFGSSVLKAQWDSIARFNQVISDLKTFNTDLFMAGDFTKLNGSSCYWSASYDGSSFTPQTNLIGGSGINSMDVFNNVLYSADDLDYGGVTGVGMWDGFTWQDGGSTNYNHFVLYADGNDLYVVSADGKVRKKTGNGSFSLFYDFAGTGGVSSIMRYNGSLIFCGSFTTIGGVACNHIAKWNGTTWAPLGTGISTGGGMAVYNNELYVAGTLTSAGGIAVNNIAKWNGTAWSPVGTGTSGNCYNGIRDMKSTSTGLIVVGDFTQMGSVNTSNVAVWNGLVWTGLGLTHGDSFANCVEVFNSKIYVGTFDFNHSHLYRYNGAVGINELSLNESNVSVYPNPSKDMVTIEIPDNSHKTAVSIKNVLGQELIVSNMNDTKQQIDISHLTNGVYFLSLESEGNKVVKKIVKD